MWAFILFRLVRRTTDKELNVILIGLKNNTHRAHGVHEDDAGVFPSFPSRVQQERRKKARSRVCIMQEFSLFLKFKDDSLLARKYSSGQSVFQ